MTAVGRGRYRLEVRVAAGGMGDVWRGTDTSLGRTVAIKLLHPHVSDDERFRQRFAAEAQYAASLHDPHIATVFDYGDDVDTSTGQHSAYLVMEFVDGVPMSDVLSGPIDPRRAAGLLAQVAEGLAAAHAAGIVHRDVKPANVIVRTDGRVKITDFGISRARGAAALTDTGTIMGTPHYLAPEIAEGREATSASDIYSLGVVLFEALAGHKPFDGDTPIAIALAHLHSQPRPLPSSVPVELRAIAEAAMARDPQARPLSAGAVAATLRDFAAQSGHGVTSVRVEPAPTQVFPVGDQGARTESAGPASARRGAWLPVAAAAAVLALMVGVAYIAQRGDQPATQLGADQRAAQQTKPTERRTAAPTNDVVSSAVTIHPRDYVDEPADDAEKQLKALGLEVHKHDVDGGEKGLVAAVEPTGPVPLGQQVTLSVYKGGHPSHDEHKPQHNPEED